MNEAQKKKRNFRNSKKWKDFRKKKMNEQADRCFLSRRKLTKHFHLHHCDLREDNYEDLSNTTNFICLNHNQHELIHYLLNGFKLYGGIDYLNRVYEETIREAKINGYI